MHHPGQGYSNGWGEAESIAAGKVERELELSLKKLRKERISKLRRLMICPTPIEKR